MHHPSTEHFVKTLRLRPLYADLNNTLTEHDLSAAIQRGEKLDLATITIQMRP
jgi:hypothetical protein